MKYQYKKTVEVIVEGELPLLGYDVVRAASAKHDQEITEAVRIGIKDNRPIQTITVGENTYKLSIYENLSTVQKSPFNPDE